MTRRPRKHRRRITTKSSIGAEAYREKNRITGQFEAFALDLIPDPDVPYVCRPVRAHRPTPYHRLESIPFLIVDEKSGQAIEVKATNYNTRFWESTPACCGE